MKIGMTLAAALLVAAPLAAQGGMGPMRGGMMTAVPNVDTLESQLSLTAEQKPKIAALVAEFEKSTRESREFITKAMESGGMQSMRDNPDAQKHFTALREARTRLAADIKAALTPGQASKYDELYPQRMGGRRPGGQ
ncbi:MAG TPA: hypothetical protein PLL69_04010 [Gemmatimonadales bacterium]|nr:hypothetical protein [Gemmatimonadales bacterium]